MSLENASFLRLCSAFVVGLLPLLGMTARAPAQSLTDTVSDAFETVVIDATKAASKAAGAAKEALAEEPTKTKRKKNAQKDAKTDDVKKDDAKKDADKKDDGPAGEAGAQSGNLTEKQTAGSKQAEGKTGPAKKADAPQPADKDHTDAAGNEPRQTSSGKDAPADKDAPTEPAAKADDGAKPDDAGKPADSAAKKPPPIPTEWPAVDVELAKARCTQLLKGVDAVTVPEAPFRKGDCGTMAPVRLISIGKNPEVSFSPPPVVTCDLVVGLTKWIKNEVQPAAKRNLGSDVIRIESMSDYSCRMAYGRVGNKLSEHGKANALDIGGFITRKGEHAMVLSHWGGTKRDVEKQIAAAKAATAKAEAVRVAAEEANKERAVAATETAKAANTGSQLPRTTLIEGLPGKKQDLAVPASVTKEGPIDMTPARLGGDKADDGKPGKKNRKDAKQGKKQPETVAALPPADEAGEAVAPAPKTPTSRFLHEIHASACRIFGTTLGPEANEAHRNHFHVDMAERKVRKICD